MYSQIINPLTREKVSIDSKSGKQILKSYIKVFQSVGMLKTVMSSFGFGAETINHEMENKILELKIAFTSLLSIINTYITEYDYNSTNPFRLGGNMEIIAHFDKLYANRTPIIIEPWFNRVFGINFKYEDHKRQDGLNELSASKFKIVTRILRDLFEKRLITFNHEVVMFFLNNNIKNNDLNILLGELNISFKQLLLKTIKGRNSMNAGAVANMLFMMFNRFNLMKQSDVNQSELSVEMASYIKSATISLNKLLEDSNIMRVEFTNKSIEKQIQKPILKRSKSAD